VASRVFVSGARRNGLSGNDIVSQLEQLRPVAMLHDEGKVGIEVAILKKPGKLEPDKSKVVERHSRIGAATLLGVRTAMDPAIRGVTPYHHALGRHGLPEPRRDRRHDARARPGHRRGAGADGRGDPALGAPRRARGHVRRADVAPSLQGGVDARGGPRGARAERRHALGPELDALFLADFGECVRLHAMVQD